MNKRHLSDKDLLRAALRADFSSFIHRSFQRLNPAATYHHNWHIEALAYHLMECVNGNIRRLLITVPPRHLKSICASVALPAFVLGHNPSARIITVSYGNELSGKFAHDSRRLMEEAWYKALFRNTRLNPKKRSVLDYETTAGGFRFTTSVGGAMTGRGGDIIIIDDPIKSNDIRSPVKRQNMLNWFAGTVSSRLDDKQTGVIIVVMQRLHVEDLAGYLLENGKDWVHLNLPAIAQEDERIQVGRDVYHVRQEGDLLHAEREPMKVLEELKASIGSADFSAQYLQAPVPAEGNIVKREWIKYYKTPPAHSEGRLVMSWDTASKGGELNDYSVCTTWLMANSDYYLLDVYRGKLDYPALRKKVISLADGWCCRTILIEDKGSGIQLYQDLIHERCGLRPIRIDPRFDKETRLSNQSPTIEAGHVFLPEYALWKDDFLDELMAFPYSKFDDQVDSFSQFLEWAQRHQRCRVRFGRTRGMI